MRKLNSVNNIPFPIALFIIAVLVYWPISTLTYSVKWDMLDTILPWRYFVSECLRNWQWPLWNPYQQAGYPIFADLRSVWYPESLFTSYFFGTSLYLLHFLLIMYIFLAGLGMYKLLKYIELPHKIAFIGGVSYLCSGYIVSQGQDMVRIIAAAGIPFVILYYLKFLNELTLKSVVRFSLVMFLMITGAYQAVTIILCYLLLVVLIWNSSIKLREKQNNYLIKSFWNHLAILGFLLLLLAPVLLSIIQTKPYVSRFSGLDLKFAEYLPFSPQSSVSFFLPFATVKESEFFATDISMRNAYFGILNLVFFVAALFRKKSPLERVLLYFGFFCLLASFGNYTPVRAVLFDYFPLMNLFRMPSYFVLFFSFSAIILACFQIQFWLENIKTERKKILLIIGSLVTLFFIVLIVSFLKIDFSKSAFFSPFITWDIFLDKTTFFEHVFLQTFIQLIILLLLFIALVLHKEKISWCFISSLLIVDLIMAVQLNIFFTMAGFQKPDAIQNYVDSSPKGFPIPHNKPIINNSDNSVSFEALWRNTNIFEKRISADGFNSFYLNGLNALQNDTFLYENTLRNPLCYLTANVCSESKWNAKKSEKLDKLLVLPDGVYDRLLIKNLKHAFNDTCLISNFHPDEFVVNVKTENSQMLCLNQSNFFGWEVFIDGKKAPIYTGNKNFITTIVPAGMHQLVFRYDNKFIKIAAFISLFIFVFLMGSQFLLFLRSSEILWQKITMLVLCFSFLIYAFFVPKLYASKYYNSFDLNEQKINGWKKEINQEVLVLKNFSSNYNIENYSALNIDSNEDLNDFFSRLKECKSECLIYSENNQRFKSETEYIIQLFYPDLVKQSKTGTLNTFLRRKTNNYVLKFKDRLILSDSISSISDSICFKNSSSQILNSKNHFSKEIKFNPDKLKKRYSDEFLIVAQANTINENCLDAYIVIQVDHLGEMKSWDSFKLPIASKWTKSLFLKKIRFSEYDEVKIYVWSPGDKDLKCREIGMEVY